MVSAWVLVTLAFLAALACAVGAYRLVRRPGAGWGRGRR
jgi:peptidoglycan/LPS O-acetylase OafA/YrhL